MLVHDVISFLLQNIITIILMMGALFFVLFVRTMRGSGQRKRILLACQWGDLDAIKELLASAPWLATQADANGFTPLHVAAMWGHCDIAERLLRAGADMNARNRAGMTPLHGAAMADHVDVVHLLLAGKADVKARDGMGNTPLYFAVWDGHRQVVELLLQYGADPLAENEKGETPLQRAEAHGHSEVISLLQD